MLTQQDITAEVLVNVWRDRYQGGIHHIDQYTDTLLQEYKHITARRIHLNGTLRLTELQMRVLTIAKNDYTYIHLYYFRTCNYLCHSTKAPSISRNNNHHKHSDIDQETQCFTSSVS